MNQNIAVTPELIEEGERLLSYWEMHGTNTEAVSKFAVEDLLGFVRFVLEGAK